MIFHTVDRCLARYSPCAQTDQPNQLTSKQAFKQFCAKWYQISRIETKKGIFRPKFNLIVQTNFFLLTIAPKFLGNLLKNHKCPWSIWGKNIQW